MKLAGPSGVEADPTQRTLDSQDVGPVKRNPCISAGVDWHITPQSSPLRTFQRRDENRCIQCYQSSRVMELSHLRVSLSLFI